MLYSIIHSVSDGKISRLTPFCLCLALAHSANAADDAANIEGMSYLNQVTFATGYRYDGWLVAGLSGIDFDAATNSFVAVRDNWISGASNGAAGSSNFPNYFTLTPTFVTGSPGYGITFTDVAAIPQLNGTSLAGFESIRLDPDGNGIWLTSETPHTIYHVLADGSTVQQLVNLPATVNGDFASGTGNYGLEGLTFTPNGSLWAAREGSIAADPVGVTRLTRLNRDGSVAAQYAYRLDNVTAVNNNNGSIANPPGPGLGNNGVTEIVALSDTSFLVMERGWDGISANANPTGVSHNYIRVYRVDIAEATDVSGISSLSATTDPYSTVTKTLVFDSTTLASTLDTYDTKIDNLEGMTLGPVLPNGHASIVLMSDNNNSNGQRKTQFLIFSIDTPIADVQFWDGSTPMADNSAGGGDGAWSFSAQSENWTREGGAVNDAWNGKIAAFSGAAGIVTIDNAAGAVTARGLQFLTSGYTLTGGDLTLAGSGAFPVYVEGAASTATIQSAIVGSGALAKSGSGTLVLRGANTYSGGTQILGGVIEVASDANLGAASGDLLLFDGVLSTTADFVSSRAVTLGGNAGGFSVADGTVLGLSGPLSGSGALLKSGLGTLVLSGVNSYTGGTMVMAGTIEGSATSIGGDVANAAVVVFDQAADATYAGNISGLDGTKGSMVKRGAGQLMLAGTSDLDWIVEAGGVTSSSDRFRGNLSLDAGTNFTFDQSYSGDYAGTISGLGNLVFSGGGLVKLSGDSSGYLGTTDVSGALSVNGMFGGSLNVLPGGRLQGSGTVGDTTLAAGATIAPGNSIGTLTVNGDLTFAAGSVYEVETAANGASDRVDVTGIATLNGASVVALALDPVASYRNSSSYTILTAGSLVGSFAPTVTLGSPFLNGLLDYTGNTVTLTIQPGASFASVAETSNQRATAIALDGLDQTAGSDSLALYNTILFSTASSARTAFDQLSGEIHASAKGGLIEETKSIRNRMGERLQVALAADRSGDALGTIASALDGETATLGGAEIWMSGYGSWGKTSVDGNTAGFDRDTGGLLFGVDGNVADGIHVGLMAGTSHSSFSVGPRASTASVDGVHVGAYAGTEIGNIGLKAGASYSFNDIDTIRSVRLSGIDQKLTGGYDSGVAQVFGEVYYGIDLSGMRVEPFANFTLVSLNTDGFAESGGSAALSSFGESEQTAFTTIGIHTATSFETAGLETSLRGSVGWRHATGDTEPTSTMRFSSGLPFAVEGTSIDTNVAVADIGLDLGLSPGSKLALRYSGQIGADSFENNLSARLDIRF